MLGRNQSLVSIDCKSGKINRYKKEPLDTKGFMLTHTGDIDFQTSTWLDCDKAKTIELFRLNPPSSLAV